MKLAERHHAFLIGLFYRALIERLEDAGEEIFIQATKEYAEQRGRRMAMRTKSHGMKLDFIGYFSHGEWAPTQPPNIVGKSYSEGDDWVILVPECPWLSAFQEMGLPECARVYCALIDTHLLKGYNPDLELEVTDFLHSADVCAFHWKNAKLGAEDWERIAAVKGSYADENIMPFSYHTGHVWKSFKAVIRKSLQDRGEELSREVIRAFEAEFGTEAAEAVQDFETTDFDILPQYGTGKN